MAELGSLSVETRVRLGKGPVKAVRAEGWVPGVFYNAKGENIPVRVKKMDLNKLYRKVGNSQVFELVIQGQDNLEKRPSIIWRMQHDPIKNQTTHVDFYGVDLEKNLRVGVPLEVTGKSKGEAEGGVLQIHHDLIEVSCKPLDVPERFVVDISELGVGDSVHIEDLEVPEGVEIVFEENFAILGITAKAAEEVEEEVEVEGEEGEAAPAEEEPSEE